MILAIAAGVAVASPQEVLDDLKPDGLIQGCYSLADYDAALGAIPPSDAQYSDYAQQIEQAKIDHVKTDGGPCPNDPTATAPETGSDSNTAGYVVWGVVGGAIAIAAALGGVLARRSRQAGGRDGSDG